MDWDDFCEAQQDVAKSAWLAKFCTYGGPGVCQIASKYRDNRECVVVGLFSGSFNFCIQVLFEDDGTEWMVRFPWPHQVIHPEVKIQHEVATMRFVKEKTNIPVPTVIAFGMAEDNPLGYGPFIITDFIKGKRLSDVLGVLRDPPDKDSAFLNPDIDDATLSIVYRQIASFILELSLHDFDKIGNLALNDVSPSSWSINSSPSTMKVNGLKACANVVIDDHPEPFSTATSYFLHLAEQNLRHLKDQRNSVDNARDGRKMYASRHLFRSMTPHFVDQQFDKGPFKLFCDDFGFHNILVDEDFKITAVLDWEWSYAAPYQFLYSPPSWLLIDHPGFWSSHAEVPNDYIDRLDDYMPKFELFARILEEEEEEKRAKEKSSDVEPSPRLSTLMRDSIANGTFWFNQAARADFTFEYFWWDRLDTLCFGPRSDGVDGRVEWLSRAPIHGGMDNFVEEKLKQFREHQLEWDIAKQASEEQKAKSSEIVEEEVNKIPEESSGDQSETQGLIEEVKLAQGENKEELKISKEEESEGQAGPNKEVLAQGTAGEKKGAVQETLGVEQRNHKTEEVVSNVEKIEAFEMAEDQTEITEMVERLEKLLEDVPKTEGEDRPIIAKRDDLSMEEDVATVKQIKGNTERDGMSTHMTGCMKENVRIVGQQEIQTGQDKEAVDQEEEKYAKYISQS